MTTTSMLLSFDLLRRINPFQNGIFLDVQALKAALQPFEQSPFRYRPSIIADHRAFLLRAGTLLAPRYAGHSTSHLQFRVEHASHTRTLLAVHAANSGYLTVLEQLHVQYTVALFNDLPLWNLAAANGHVHILHFLHSIRCMPTHEVNGVIAPSTHNPKIVASASGHLAVVDWLHRNNLKFDAMASTTPLAKSYAGQWTSSAANGHLHVLTWLYDYMMEAPCTTFAMDEAAQNGHLDVLQWLRNHRTEGATDASVRYAAEKNHLDVLRWLLANGFSPTTSPWAIVVAAEHGHLEAIQILHEIGWPAKAMDKAAKYGFLGIVQWLHDH
ncbi:Aste57867_19227 [Aphanomyces stellatus]|uniref:Aste57867_15744 protein n=1 Tax=Aphanomyces stellatus TaxID=120398 RepID=A0A485LDS0_9STRA|nr:hypothetical protein As57867_019163 [Aphanomyces stellatus]KAF0693267.1 hypothetical protein As57867_015688 [Aphanomyces stellatus]VFT92533.1 Aste57867_15744 [Aphanomyces stellatus]VFT95948.1 Aste57867_19227 [Aphanomyces stellatus]